MTSIEAGRPLSAQALKLSADPARLRFRSTADVEPAGAIPGQERAVEAMRFAAAMNLRGHNAYVLGPSGSGRHAFIREFLGNEARQKPTPRDCCYVNNFADHRSPRALLLGPGLGKQLRADVSQVVLDAQSAIPVAFESEEFQNQREALSTEFKHRQEQAFSELEEDAKRRSIGIVQTPGGFAFVPLRDQEAIRPQDFEGLPEQTQRRYREDMEALSRQLQRITRSIPKQARDMRQKMRELEREVTTMAVTGLIDDLLEKYRDNDAVTAHLRAMQDDIIDNVHLFLGHAEPETTHASESLLAPGSNEVARRYAVNVLVDRSDCEGAPVICEDQPGFGELIGKIEYESHFGALVTDFSLIRAGALHRANGGYLIVDAAKLLSYPRAWEGLKLAIRSGEIRTRSLGDELGLGSTVSLEPQPIPLDVKVVLVGERIYYYLLSQLDPEFLTLFKVAADFEDRIERSEENVSAVLAYCAGLIRREKLRHLDPDGAARLFEHSARLCGDRERLSADVRRLSDVLREAHYWATQEGNELIGSADVQRAIDSHNRRASRVRDRMLEETVRETVVVETSGMRIGQVNGLSVLQLGDYFFGRPQRITASVTLGSGKVVDIEREVELGGPLHSKGVLILSAFLSSHYVTDRPLCLSASLVFEQSYGEVDGDSASAAEMCALASAVARIPLRQSLAITGSVDQHGRVQAIGGVNEKIEGFFELCRARGLSGDQGVLIPLANVKHLMLSQDVIDAVEHGEFHVYPVDTVDRCLELLTGMPAGDPDETGEFPEGTFNRAVRVRLLDLAQHSRAFRESTDNDTGKQ